MPSIAAPPTRKNSRRENPSHKRPGSCGNDNIYCFLHCVGAIFRIWARVANAPTTDNGSSPTRVNFSD